MNRRTLLAAAIAAMAAPVVHASQQPGILRLWGDGVHDDTQALQALIWGRAVAFGDQTLRRDGRGVVRLPAGTFRVRLLAA